MTASQANVSIDDEKGAGIVVSRGKEWSGENDTLVRKVMNGVCTNDKRKTNGRTE